MQALTPSRRARLTNFSWESLRRRALSTSRGALQEASFVGRKGVPLVHDLDGISISKSEPETASTPRTQLGTRLVSIAARRQSTGGANAESVDANVYRNDPRPGMGGFSRPTNRSSRGKSQTKPPTEYRQSTSRPSETQPERDHREKQPASKHVLDRRQMESQFSEDRALVELSVRRQTPPIDSQSSNAVEAHKGDREVKNRSSTSSGRAGIENDQMAGSNPIAYRSEQTSPRRVSNPKRFSEISEIDLAQQEQDSRQFVKSRQNRVPSSGDKKAIGRTSSNKGGKRSSAQESDIRARPSEARTQNSASDRTPSDLRSENKNVKSASPRSEGAEGAKNVKRAEETEGEKGEKGAEGEKETEGGQEEDIPNKTVDDYAGPGRPERKYSSDGILQLPKYHRQLNDPVTPTITRQPDPSLYFDSPDAIRAQQFFSPFLKTSSYTRIGPPENAAQQALASLGVIDNAKLALTRVRDLNIDDRTEALGIVQRFAERSLKVQKRAAV